MRTSIKLHRLARGMKQSDLADLVDVRRETIGRLEQGLYCPSLRLAMDLARVFDTTVEELFSFDDEEAGSPGGKATAPAATGRTQAKR
ncbi:helix-turn-helix transcriptional regulator [Bifidobacterium platyrrhinorum]|uniref:Helix-turn-helix domain-containing protein n=1 Tax=Bifidobacterium platyrrhinorum TaxID=2661628 RepID=A0A6L9SSV6_9BIFI|nr:helix-turn-helix transcriptional regulator [Bifidobacterium platyrrhinorum]NEG55155.1 helix-turn-helix domain-containing protein [Bifidobacterium platyrrhinorum]